MLASPNMEAKSQLLSLKRPLKYGESFENTLFYLNIIFFPYTPSNQFFLLYPDLFLEPN